MHLQSIRYVRYAGVLYLFVIVAGLFSELFVRTRIIVPGNATETMKLLSSNKLLYRLGFVSDIIMVMADIGLALLFYLLLNPISKGLSLLAALFRLTQASILGIHLLHLYLPLQLLDHNGYFSGFSVEQINGLALFFMNAHAYGYLISGVFFGMSCVLLGHLIVKATFFPKWLGILVGAAGASYLAYCFTNFLFPELATLSEFLVMTVAVVSEVTLCVFLLVKGNTSNETKEPIGIIKM